MDLNFLKECNRLALQHQESAGSDEERRAYRQFARDHFLRNQVACTKGGSEDVTVVSPTESIRLDKQT